MLGMMAESLALISLVAAGAAIGWLLVVRKQLLSLGKRILESEDIGRILQAAEKVGTFESRMTGCENKAGESQRQLSEHETKLGELISKQGASEQGIAGYSADLAKISNQLSELQTKVNEFASKIESIEATAGRNETGLTEIIPSIKNLAEEIQNLQKFQTATEKTHSLIQAAFADMGANMSPEEGEQITHHVTEPEQNQQWPEDVHQEAEGQNTTETCNVSIEENPESWRTQ